MVALVACIGLAGKILIGRFHTNVSTATFSGPCQRALSDWSAGITWSGSGSLAVMNSKWSRHFKHTAKMELKIQIMKMILWKINLRKYILFLSTKSLQIYHIDKVLDKVVLKPTVICFYFLHLFILFIGVKSVKVLFSIFVVAFCLYLFLGEGNSGYSKWAIFYTFSETIQYFILWFIHISGYRTVP